MLSPNQAGCGANNAEFLYAEKKAAEELKILHDHEGQLRVGFVRPSRDLDAIELLARTWSQLCTQVCRLYIDRELTFRFQSCHGDMHGPSKGFGRTIRRTHLLN